MAQNITPLRDSPYESDKPIFSAAYRNKMLCQIKCFIWEILPSVAQQKLWEDLGTWLYYTARQQDHEQSGKAEK